MNLTEKAISAARARLTHGEYLRISVDGGGCSGFKLDLSKDSARGDDDIVLGDIALIDVQSLEILQGALLDYSTGPFEQTFKLTPPPGASSCGCGSSFTMPESK